MDKPSLYIFAGLPGTGKSTLAQTLSRATGATYLRIDTIEQGLRELCGVNVIAEGYRLAYRIAEDNLTVGNSVIADSCNPLELTRQEWMRCASDAGAHGVNIEIVCTDDAEHQQRVETRRSEVPGLRLPTWDQVLNREYHSWSCERLVIDTAGKTIQSCAEELQARLQSWRCG